MIRHVLTLCAFAALVAAYRLPRQASMRQPTSLRDVKESLLSSIDGAVDDVLVCPESLGDLVKTTRYYGFVEETQYTNKQFDTKYPAIPFRYIDLTIKSEIDRPLYSLTPRELIGQNLFQTRLLSSIYERGYRQNFATIGFPGADKEFEEAQSLFQATGAKRILDLSCGSGFMTRRFIASGKYDSVYSADLSPTMLAETRRRIKSERLKMPTLVRCDAARLPFRSGSLDAVHAGAAMHCWPRVNETLAEIYRVLKPGGVYFATTIYANAPAASRGFYLYKDEGDLEGRLEGAGFGGDSGAHNVRRVGRACAILKAIKGPLPSKGTDDVLDKTFASYYDSLDKPASSEDQQPDMQSYVDSLVSTAVEEETEVVETEVADSAAVAVETEPVGAGEEAVSASDDESSKLADEAVQEEFGAEAEAAEGSAEDGQEKSSE